MYDITISTINDEPRILASGSELPDTDLAEALGFDRPRKIRELIQRHLPSLLAMGLCPTVGRSTGGRPATEFYLSQEQALFIVAKSETPGRWADATDLMHPYGYTQSSRGPTMDGGDRKSWQYKELRQRMN